jgi:type IV secretion system protein VirB1
MMLWDYAACAPQVAPETIAAIIRVESAGNMLTVAPNGGPMVRRAVDAADAAQIARYAIAYSKSVDLGLMQVNSRNLAALGYQVEDMFDPCKNIRAGATILAADYAAAVVRFGEGQDALRVALSLYNTGDFERGFANGYVAKYYGSVRVSSTISKVPELIGPALPKPANPYIADIQVYARKEASNEASPIPNN